MKPINGVHSTYIATHQIVWPKTLKTAINHEIKAVVKSIIGNVVSLNTDYGIIKVPLVDNNLVVNQSISIGVYDMSDRTNIPDRTDISDKINMLQLQIIIPGVIDSDNNTYQFLIRRNLDNAWHDSLQTDDVVEVTQQHCLQKLYQLTALNHLGQAVKISVELNNLGQDKIFLQNNRIYVQVDDRLYQVVDKTSDLEKILSVSTQTIAVTISQEFSLKEHIEHLLAILPSTLPVKTLSEIASLLSQSQVQIPASVDYLTAYKLVLSSVFNQFKRTKLRIRESRSGGKTIRFILELESKDRVLSIIDCLYISSSNALNVMVRSSVELSDDFKTNFSASFNKLLSEMCFSGSISFSVQSTDTLKKILTDKPDHPLVKSYTCSV